MTETQFLTLVGTIWIAPHVDKWYAVMVGFIFLFVSALKGLGVI
jgi:hypothetical protein